MIVSRGQQSNSAIHIHVSSLFPLIQAATEYVHFNWEFFFKKDMGCPFLVNDCIASVLTWHLWNPLPSETAVTLTPKHKILQWMVIAPIDQWEFLPKGPLMVQKELRILGTVEGRSQKLDFFRFNISVVCRIMPSCRRPLHNPQSSVTVILRWQKGLCRWNGIKDTQP